MRANALYSRFASVFLSLMPALGAIAQVPRRADCRQWDDGFIGVFQVGLLITTAIVLVAVLMSGGLVKLFPGKWMARRPWYRAVLIALVAGAVFLICFVAVPQRYLGPPFYGSVDPAYRLCAASPFGAVGFVGGNVGRGTAAIALVPHMVGLTLSAIGLGAFLGWLVGRLSSRRHRSQV